MYMAHKCICLSSLFCPISITQLCQWSKLQPSETWNSFTHANSIHQISSIKWEGSGLWCYDVTNDWFRRTYMYVYMIYMYTYIAVFMWRIFMFWQAMSYPSHFQRNTQCTYACIHVCTCTCTCIVVQNGWTIILWSCVHCNYDSSNTCT